MVARANAILQPARRGQVERKDGRMLRRFTIYLNQGLARRLTVRCATAEVGISEFIASTLEHALSSVEPGSSGGRHDWTADQPLREPESARGASLPKEQDFLPREGRARSRPDGKGPGRP